MKKIIFGTDRNTDRKTLGNRAVGVKIATVEMRYTKKQKNFQIILAFYNLV